MEYSTEDLPASCLVQGNGNFQTRNARFRSAVCEHLRLQVVRVNGSGNCFFESVIMLLRAADLCPDTMSALQLRRDVVQFFRACVGSREHYCERVLIEIENELNEALICSSRAKVNRVRVHGLVPAAIPVYLDAVDQEGVWVTGTHWLRAISLLYNVRVAVVIFGHPIVRFFGQGSVTIYLYKIDAETHFDPMLPAPGEAAVAAEPPPSAAGEAVVAAEPPQTVVLSSSTDEDELVHSERPLLVTDTHTEDGRFARLSCLKHKEASVSSIVAPATAAAAAPGKCAPLPHYSVHFFIQSQCAALPECSAFRTAPMMTPLPQMYTFVLYMR